MSILECDAKIQQVSFIKASCSKIWDQISEHFLLCCTKIQWFWIFFQKHLISSVTVYGFPESWFFPFEQFNLCLVFFQFYWYIIDIQHFTNSRWKQWLMTDKCIYCTMIPTIIFVNIHYHIHLYIFFSCDDNFKDLYS